VLIFSSLPAFLLGLFIVDDLAIWSVTKVLSFMIVTPVLIAAWFYMVGWLIERVTPKVFADGPRKFWVCGRGPQ
jgi:hypothetical protein